MDWSALGKQVAGMGLPLLGTALGGPAGGLIGQWIAGKIGGDHTDPATGELNPQSIFDALKKDQDAILKLKELEQQHETELLRIATEAETKRIEAVNATMQAETKSEHWAQWGWRPYCGFCFGTAWLGDYFVLPLLHVGTASIPTEAWMAMGAVLGVASWFRGKAKLTAQQGEDQ